jgi:hypothetical protein
MTATLEFYFGRELAEFRQHVGGYKEARLLDIIDWLDKKLADKTALVDSLIEYIDLEKEGGGDPCQRGPTADGQ